MTAFTGLTTLAGVLIVLLSLAEANPTAAPCRRMTAAYGPSFNRFIFFGNDVIGLDADFKQYAKGDSYDIMRAPYPEAAFLWPVDNMFYAFSDAYYFSYWTNFSPVDAEVFGGKTHGEFFKNGLDAAGNLNGSTLFFKGCQYVQSFPSYSTDPMELPATIPCNLDAAMTVGDDLYLFKYDKMWKLTPEGLADGMPVDTSSVITFDGITLCPEPAKED